MPDHAHDARLAADEIANAVAALDRASFARLTDTLATARRIVVSGAGREGLMMRALAMRLYHLGLDAHVAGEMGWPGPKRFV
jgi:6-phospho-3-hexuloisomerase